LVDELKVSWKEYYSKAWLSSHLDGRTQAPPEEAEHADEPVVIFVSSSVYWSYMIDGKPIPWKSGVNSTAEISVKF